MSSADFEALCAEARQAVKDRRLPEAIKLYSKATTLKPDDSVAFEGLATAYYIAKDFERAIRTFERLTQLKPRDVKAFVNLGALYNVQREFKKAAESLRKAVQRDSKSADAFYNLGIAERGNNQLVNAVSAYKECVRLKPDMAEGHVNLANCLVEQKNYKKATEHYELALKHRPDFKSAMQGIKHVQALVLEGKQDVNPFGRLVDSERLLSNKAGHASYRSLSDDERFEDRQFMTLTTSDAIESAEHFRKHMTEHFEPSLLAINRIMARDTRDQHAFEKLQARQHEVWQFAKTLYQRMQADFQKLREHEAGMK